MTSDNLRNAFRAFTTTCALITTDGAHGPNVMAAEWTFNVSYRPFLILVSIDPGNRTHDLILEAKEFGVNLVTEGQIAAMGFAGHYSKEDTDKLSSGLFETYPGEKIRAPMIQGALLNAECRLLETRILGDHTAFIGEVVAFRVNPEGRPLILHRGSHRLGERIVRTPQLALAGTPMQVSAGSSLSVTGELTGPERAGVPVAVRLRSPDGATAAETRATTDLEGGFRVQLAIARDGRPGSWTLEGDAGSVRGLARITVV